MDYFVVYISLIMFKFKLYLDFRRPQTCQTGLGGSLIWHIASIHMPTVYFNLNEGLRFYMPHRNPRSVLRRRWLLFTDCTTAQQTERQIRSHVMTFFESLFLIPSSIISCGAFWQWLLLRFLTVQVSNPMPTLRRREFAVVWCSVEYFATCCPFTVKSY